jgi:hypothetical protein
MPLTQNVGSDPRRMKEDDNRWFELTDIALKFTERNLKVTVYRIENRMVPVQTDIFYNIDTIKVWKQYGGVFFDTSTQKYIP